MIRTISTIGRSITGLFDFSGRVSLLTFWLLYIPLLAFCLVEMQSVRPMLPKPLWSLPIAFLFFSGGVKRLHDRGHSGWWSLILLLGTIVIPVVGLPLLCFEWCLMPGKPGDNEYGPGPAGRASRFGARLTLDPLDWLAAWLGFEGRISRLRFWFFHLLPFIVMFYYVVLANPFRLKDRQFEELGLACVFLYCAGQTKRLHDLNMPASLVTYIPPISLYFLFRCMFETGSAGPNRFGPAPSRRAQIRAQARPLNGKALAGALGDTLKRAKDDKLLIQILSKQANSDALSKEQRRKACVALARLLHRKNNEAGAAAYWRMAYDLRPDPTCGFNAAVAQINAEECVSADTKDFLKKVLRRAPEDFPKRARLESYLAFAARK